MALRGLRISALVATFSIRQSAVLKIVKFVRRFSTRQGTDEETASSAQWGEGIKTVITRAFSSDSILTFVTRRDGHNAVALQFDAETAKPRDV